MKHTIRYAGTKQEMLNAALKDAREYLGDKYALVKDVLKDNIKKHGVRKTIKCYRFILSFAGIEGLPAKAIMLDVLNGELK